MLSEEEVLLLVKGRHADPFSVLGMHRDAEGAMWLRAFLPLAEDVWLHEADNGRRVVRLAQRHPLGLWEAYVPKRRHQFDYRLQIVWSDGTRGRYADAYMFGLLLDQTDLEALAHGLHERPYSVLGAHAWTLEEVEGVRFSVWAPNALRVSVIGDFNGWDERRHPMRLRHEAGVWEIFVPHAVVGDLYKFAVLGPDGQALPHKADPFARAAQRSPQTASVVAPPLTTAPLPAARAQANSRQAPISIYEVHLGSWRRNADGRSRPWEELAHILPEYVADLGFTHVEFMPVTEHPADDPWGYQCTGLYAPANRFGRPEGFARLVAACRARGLGVLVDWVPDHFARVEHGLARFDGTPLYEGSHPRDALHSDWQTLGYNYASLGVRNYLAGSARYWIECQGVDGLRVDALSSMLWREPARASAEPDDGPGDTEPNPGAVDFLRAAHAGLERFEPAAFTIAADAGEAREASDAATVPGLALATGDGGLGFRYLWNPRWVQDTLAYMREDPVHRRWHHARIATALEHACDQAYVLALSHREVVHGQGSLLDRMPGDKWQRFANLRAYYGLMWGHPGKKLLFMGQEFAQTHDWNHDAELPWHLLEDESHVGVQRLVRDLNALYRDNPALHELDADPSGFEWLEANDDERSVFAWTRTDRAGNPMIVVCNFTPVPRYGLRLGVPGASLAWREVLNTDSYYYGGSNVGNQGGSRPVEPQPSHGRAQSIVLTLPPLATIFLQPE